MPAIRAFILCDRDTDTAVRTLPVAGDETLFEALRRADVPLRTVCLGSQMCGLCAVTVADPGALPEPDADEVALLSRTAGDVPFPRLACRIRLPADRETLRVATDYWR